jgi:predicted dehydrogenase
MDPRNPGSFPPGGSQPPFGQPYGNQPFGQAGGPGQPGGGFGPQNPNAYQPPGYGGSAYGNPYGDPRFSPQPPKKSRLWLWLLLGGGGVLALMCCGCFGLMLFGFNVIEEELTTQLRKDPVVQERIGEVESVEFDFMKSIDETQKEGGDDEALVFEIKGSKGSGTVIGRTETGPDGAERMTGGILRLPSGEEFQLTE